MNFISEPGKEVAVELKYCERCGGLWLRPQGGEGVYCPGCCVRLAGLPERKGRLLKRQATEGSLEGQSCIVSLRGVAEMGVEA